MLTNVEYTELMYDMDFDHEHRVLRISTRGMWTTSIHAKFVAEVLARGIPQRVRYGSIAVFADMRDAPIQPAELNGLTQSLISRVIMMNRGPMIFVVGSMLGKMQAEHVLSAPTCRVFLDIDEARAWLQHCWIDQGYAVTNHIRQAYDARTYGHAPRMTGERPR